MSWDTDNNDGSRNSDINTTNKKKEDFCEIDPTAGAKSNRCKNCNLDLPFGFQDIDPMLITVLGEVVGNILSGNMPTNVANAFGNWLQLIAQVIVMFNAQQQYSQGGPGRYYSPDYRNIANPYTAEPGTSDGDEAIVKKKKKKGKRKRHKDDFYEDNNEVNKIIEQLKDEISLLKKEIAELKK